MTGKPHPVGVIHGRFQVLHNDHLRYLLAGWARCEHLVVGVTNPDPERTRPHPADPQRSAPENNPLTYYERQILLRGTLGAAGVPAEALTVVPLPIDRPELYGAYVPLDAVFFLTIYDAWGRAKLELFQQRGLRVEVLWERPPELKGLSAGAVRRAMTAGEPWQHLVPPCVAERLLAWDLAARLRTLQAGDQAT